MKKTWETPVLCEMELEQTTLPNLDLNTLWSMRAGILPAS